MISSLLKEFVFDLQIKNYSEKTIETYNYNCTQLVYYLRDSFEIDDIEDVSTLHVKKFIQHQTSIGNKPTYINSLIKSLRAFYVFLVEEEYVTLNVMKKVKFLKEEMPIIKTFTDQEVARLLDAYNFKTYLNARNKVIIAMFVDTGIRLSELINLQTEWVYDTNLNVFGKGKRWRHVPIRMPQRPKKPSRTIISSVILLIHYCCLKYS